MKTLRTVAIFGLTAALLLGATAPASAAVWSSEGRPLMQTHDVAGTGEFNELDGPVGEAQFRQPAGVLVLADGGVLVADTGNHRIRVIRDGTVSVHAGIAVSVAFDDSGQPAGALIDGPAAESLFANPIGMAADAHGNVYVADAANHAIRKITPSGEVSTLAGNGVLGSADGTGSEASFYWPMDVAVDAAGNVYVADTLNHAIRKISPQGEVTTLNALSTRTVEVFPGVVEAAGDFADGPLSEALFNEPSGLALDSSGNLYVSDSGNQRIRYIDFAAGTVVTVAGGGDYGENGLYAAGSYVDGPAAQARFHSPKGLAVDADGGVYIADSLNHSIRYMKDGRVTTVVGNPVREYGNRNGFDEKALLDYPADVAIHPSGDLYVADMYNNKIRKVTFYALPNGWTADGTIRVLLNNQQIVFGTPPEMRADRTMVPVHTLAQALGFEVAVSGADIVLSGTAGTVTMAVGQTDVSLGDADGTTTVDIDVAPYIRHGQAYVPVRFLAELIGIDVDWHAETTTVILRR